MGIVNQTWRNAMVVRRTDSTSGHRPEFPQGRPIPKSLAKERDDTKKAVSNIRFGEFGENDHDYSTGGVGKNLSKLAWKKMIHFKIY